MVYTRHFFECEECEKFVKNWFHSIYKGKKGEKNAPANNFKNLDRGF